MAKMHRIEVVILFIAAFLFEKGFTKIPDFIHPCNHNNQTCLLKSIQDAIPGFSKGLPDLGVPPLDPFYVEKLSVSLPGLKISFHKSKVSGLRKAVVEDAHFKNNKLTIAIRGNVTLKGQYEIEGMVLAFPINGKGDAKIKMTNLKTTYIISTDIITDDEGVKHFIAKNYKQNYAYDDTSKATYNLTNLFVGNPEISSSILTFLNENWRLIAEDFGKPVLDYGNALAVKAIEKFFLAIPYAELIDGPLP